MIDKTLSLYIMQMIDQIFINMAIIIVMKTISEWEKGTSHTKILLTLTKLKGFSFFKETSLIWIPKSTRGYKSIYFIWLFSQAVTIYTSALFTFRSVKADVMQYTSYYMWCVRYLPEFWFFNKLARILFLKLACSFQYFHLPASITILYAISL